MGGTKDSMPLAIAFVSAALVGCAWCREGTCRQDGRHKLKPGPEPYLRDCMLYEENSCCSEDQIKDIIGSPATVMANESWDWCGSLSPNCQDFLKRMACFHHCSPDAMLWVHPHRPDAIQATPLCHSFCTDWFEACKNDLTCARNWTTDWVGANCTGPCVSFQQMYKDGRDLCDHLWGDAFQTAEDSEDGGDGGPCCLTMGLSDGAAIDALRESQEATKRGRRPGRSCRLQPAAPPQARRGGQRVVMGKPSVAKDDAEGSGSGF